MRIRGRAVLVVVALVGAFSSGTPRADSAAPCVDDSRACVIATAQTYLDALLSHKPASVRLAPDVVRYENGIESARGAANMRRSLKNFPLYKVITRIRNVRWIVDGGNAVAFYLIDTNAIPGVDQHAATAHVSEWFHVRRGLITRIDLVVCFAGGLSPQSSQASSRAGLLTDLCVRTGPQGV